MWIADQVKARKGHHARELACTHVKFLEPRKRHTRWARSSVNRALTKSSSGDKQWCLAQQLGRVTTDLVPNRGLAYPATDRQ